MMYFKKHMMRLILYPRTRNMTRLRGCEAARLRTIIHMYLTSIWSSIYLSLSWRKLLVLCKSMYIHYSPPRLHRCIVSSNSRQNCPFIKRYWLMLGLRVVIDMSDSMGSNRNKEGTWKGTVVFRIVIARHKGPGGRKGQGCNYAVLYIHTSTNTK